MTPTWAVIPSEGRSCLHDCIASVRNQVDGIVVVANGGYDGADLTGVAIVRDLDSHPNISRWWNIGIKAVPEDVCNVLVLNDDVVMQPGSVARLGSALRASQCILAFPGHADKVLNGPAPERITGWCFMLRGESGILADESMEWWYGDNDLDWRARVLSGSLMVSRVDTHHQDPNGYTNRNPTLAAQTSLDRETFIKIWGRLPH